jgi:predicted MPP superfamily phosphohydrolase
MDRYPVQITRRQFLIAASASALGGLTYVRAVEPRWLSVTRPNVRLDARTGAPFTLLHLSDLHASRVVSLSFLAAAVRQGLALRPDLICLTGDFITRGYDAPEDYARVLRPLSEAAPTFACLGNHDGGAWAARRRGDADTTRVRSLLHRAGITLLHNTARTVQVRGHTVRLVGLGDLWAGDFQPARAFAAAPADDLPTIVLAHNPDARRALQPYGWDLMLSGHTHGGQVKLPWIGPLVLPIRDRRFAEGLCRWEGRWIYVTRGVGNLWGIRFNCPPEITFLTVTPAREITPTRPLRPARPGHRLVLASRSAAARAPVAGI